MLRPGKVNCGMTMERWPFSVGKERQQRLEVVISKMFDVHHLYVTNM